MDILIVAFVIRDTSPVENKVPDRKCYWSANSKFSSVWSADKLIQNINFISLECSLLFFSSKSKYNKKKESSLQDEGSNTKFSY